jgi:hypothetical protein
MQEREARLLSESNDLEKVVIQPTTENNGWTLQLVAKNGDHHMLNSKRSKEPRVFKTSDACLRCCSRIGINTATVAL